MFKLKNLLLISALLFTANLSANAQKIIKYEGNLEKGKTYRAEFVFNQKYNDWQPVKRLNLPSHHAGRIELTNIKSFPALQKAKPNERREFIFKVISKEVYQADKRRWNTIYHCRITEWH